MTESMLFGVSTARNPVYCLYRRGGTDGNITHWYYTAEYQHLCSGHQWHWLYAYDVPWRRWVQEAIKAQNNLEYR